MSAITTEAYRPGKRRIVSVDGEGKNPRGRHAYTMICAADDRGYRDYIEHDGSLRAAIRNEGPRYGKTQYHADDVAANHGLPTKRVLDFLLSIPEDKSDLVISFSFNYDVTKIVQDLPYAAQREFWSLGFTVWEGYLISGIPRKYFQVDTAGKSVRVWDVFAYWQMAFAKALDSSPELFSDAQREVIEFIARMKRERENFDRMPDAEILEYCFNECEYLTIMYRDILRHIDDMGLRQSAHSGPGSIASAFFAGEHLKDFMPEGSPHTFLAGLPVSVATHSYYGGRFEARKQGLVGNQHEYDIQSAYPSIAVNLPCLKHGRFRKVTDFVPGRLGFYFVGSHTSGPWAPFPFRADAESGRAYLNKASKGSIAFVHGGRRWVTSDEVSVAREYFGADAIPVFSGWVYEPGCAHKPFKRLVSMYLKRKIGDPTCSACLAGRIPPGESERKYFCDAHAEPSAGLSKVIKLIINSVYGKLAQAIGWKMNPKSQYGNRAESYDAPVYQCYIWAAWITGGTRAKVLDAALRAGRDADCPDCRSGDMFRACDVHAAVNAIATDGILSDEEIPSLNVHDYELGSWEHKFRPDTWVGMPGIYSFRDDGKPDKCAQCKALGSACPVHASDKKFKRRGLDSRYFPADWLRKAWEDGLWSIGPMGNRECRKCQRKTRDKFPMEPCPDHVMRGFMPGKLAMTRSDALECYGEWVQMKKVVKFLSIMHKRNYPAGIDPMLGHPRMIALDSITVPDDARSAPYEPKQTWEDIARGRADDPDIPMYSESEDIPEVSEIDALI